MINEGHKARLLCVFVYFLYIFRDFFFLIHFGNKTVLNNTVTVTWIYDFITHIQFNGHINHTTSHGLRNLTTIWKKKRTKFSNVHVLWTTKSCIFFHDASSHLFEHFQPLFGVIEQEHKRSALFPASLYLCPN